MNNTFLPNKYSNTYFRIIQRARIQNIEKKPGFQSHHIIPKCIGGTDDPNNLVFLSYKEHRVCHCLLIKMVTDKSDSIKMRHAYGFFNKNSVFNGPRYRCGKDNSFAHPKVVAIVRERMINNNPMKNPEIQARRLASWRASRAKMGVIPPRVLKDKFITPVGVFKSKKQIIREAKIPEWILNTIYNNLDSLPTSNGRRSKNIDHLQIDYLKTWRQNGFDIIDMHSTKN